jgi:Glycosyltransferase family 87
MVLGPLIYDRIDIVLGAILLVAVISLLRQHEGRFKLAIGIGIAFKIIPIVLVPMILARNWKRWWLLVLPTILSFGTIVILGGHFDRFLEFHVQRPIQLESGPASVAMHLGIAGPTSFSYGSVNVDAPHWLALVGTVLLGVVCIVAAWIGRKMSAESFAFLLAAVLSLALVLSKVLSPQYFLFLLPVLVALPIGRTTWVLIALIYLLTGLIFPLWYDDLTILRPAAEFALILRNELMLGLGISLAWQAMNR